MVQAVLARGLAIDCLEDGAGSRVRGAAIAALARRHPVCKGFAVGRTIFGKPAEAWFKGEIKDQEAVERMAAGYRRLIDIWERLAPPRAA